MNYAGTASGRIAYAGAGSGPVALFVRGVLTNKHLQPFVRTGQRTRGLARFVTEFDNKHTRGESSP